MADAVTRNRDGTGHGRSRAVHGGRLHRERGAGQRAAVELPDAAIVALVCGTAVGAFTGGLVPGTSGFGHTYIGFPALQAWVTGAVVYLVGVAAVARGAKAKSLLGYSRIEEIDAASTAPVGGAGDHGGS
jgi:hypothetical protein